MKLSGRSGSRHILVTGATGFIGLNLIDKLLKDTNDYIYALSNRQYLPNIYKDIPPNRLKSYLGDLSDFKSIRRIVTETKPEYVVHLGGMVDLDRSHKVVISCVESNIKGTVNLLESIRGLGVKRFVFCSTTEVYGERDAPFVETQEADVISPYSITKLSGEMFCRLYFKLYGVPAVILRLSNIYGPWQKKQRLIPMIILAALKGEDILLDSGDRIKDFCYVSDVVEALLGSLDSDKAINEIINIGSGKGVEIRVVAEAVVKETNSGSKIILRPGMSRALENKVCYCDCNKAQETLGWTPKVDLKKGLRSTIQWYELNTEKI